MNFQHELPAVPDMTFSIQRVCATTALIVGLAVTGWSIRSLTKSDAPKPAINLEDEGGRCPPTISEILGIKGPPPKLESFIVFVAGLVISYRSALCLMEVDPRNKRKGNAF